jgi:glycosyltransferase involved in cell wall biosynthesis
MIIDPENYIQLSNAMEKIILLSNEERMRMGENGMKRIKAKYSINKALNIYSQLYASK